MINLMQAVENNVSSHRPVRRARKLPRYLRKQLPLGGCTAQGRCERTVATLEQLKQADYGLE
jgi:hypothetical protein